MSRPDGVHGPRRAISFEGLRLRHGDRVAPVDGDELGYVARIRHPHHVFVQRTVEAGGFVYTEAVGWFSPGSLEVIR